MRRIINKQNQLVVGTDNALAKTWKLRQRMELYICCKFVCTGWSLDAGNTILIYLLFLTLINDVFDYSWELRTVLGTLRKLFIH
jgi:hypothetical protein